MGLTVLVLVTKTAEADSTWKGTLSSDLGTDGNWFPVGVPSSATDVATFDSNASQYVPTLTTVPTQLGILSFPAADAQSYTFNFNVPSSFGPALTIAGGVTNPSGLTQTFNINQGVTVLFDPGASSGDSSQVTYALTGGILQFSGSSFGNANISLGDGLLGSTLNLPTSGSNTVSIGAITGSKMSSIDLGDTDLYIQGPGTLAIDSTIIGTGGTLSLNAPNNTLTLSSLTSDYTGGTNLYSGTLSISAQQNVGTGSINFLTPGTTESSDNSTLQITSDLELLNSNAITIENGFTAIFDVSSGVTATLDGSISDLSSITGVGGNVSIIGGGTVVYNAPNFYTGQTTISDGTLSISDPDVLQGSSLILFNPGATGATSSTLLVTDSLQLPGSQNIQIADGFTANLNATTGFEAVINGIISDETTGGIVQSTGPSGVLTLTNANTYSGGTIINGAGVQIGQGTSLGTGSVLFTFPPLGSSSEAALDYLSTMTVNNDIVIGDGTIASINSDLNSVNLYELTLNGSITNAIGPTSGELLLLKGTLKLNNTENSFTGTSLINSASMIAGGNGTLPFNSDINMISGFLSTEDFTNTIYSLVGSGTVDLGTTGSGELTISQGGNFSGNVTGRGGIDLLAGTFILSGDNDYFGTTTIESGSEIIAGSTTAFSPSSPFTVDGTLTLNDGTNNFSNTIFSLSGDGTVDLGSSVNPAVLTISGTGNQIFSGAIHSSGGLTLAVGTTQGLSGLTDYSGPTEVDGTLNALSATALSSNSNFTVDGTLDLNDFSNSIKSVSGTGSVSLGVLPATVLTLNSGNFLGVISGVGGVTKDTGGILALSGVNTYQGGTTINGGAISMQMGGMLDTSGSLAFGTAGIFDISSINASTFTIGDLSGGNGSSTSIMLGDKTLMVGTKNSTSFAGVIQGNSDSVFFKQGSGSLALTSPFSFAGDTTVAAGTLIGNTSNLLNQITIDSGANLTFNQLTAGNFTGTLLGSGMVVKKGPGTLDFIVDNRLFDGTTTINQGNFALNALLGGDLIVQNSGILSGVGEILDNLLVTSGGTIAPGNSIGTLTVGGNYVQNRGTTYLVQIDGSDQSTLIDVFGTATLNGGNVAVNALNGQYDINQTYTILTASQGVLGVFDSVSTSSLLGDPALLKAELIYRPNSVLFEIQPEIVNAASTYNERQIALALDGIQNPNPFETSILNAIISLSVPAAAEVLNELSGEQYTNERFGTELGSRRFLRRLFDPLRPLVANPCPLNLGCECTPDIWYQGWFTAGGGSTYLNSDLNTSGFKMNSWDVTLGGQATFLDDLTLGVAGSYEEDTMTYYLAGNGKRDQYFAALYGLYRPECFYVLTDLTFGYSANKINRPILIGDLTFRATARPETYDLSFYGEAGFDLTFGPLLAQPFFGLETFSYWRKGFTESGFQEFGLHVHSRNRTAVNSRLGLHLTTISWPLGLSLSLDAAWQYRISTEDNLLEENFLNSSDLIGIRGVRIGRNSAEGALTLSEEVNENFSLYVELSGEAWGYASTYDISGGLFLRW